MATHIIYDRIAPLAPIRDPTTVMTLLFNMKPSAQRAQPEYELRTVITTGMSAPPIAMVRVMPMTPERVAVVPNIAKPTDMVGSTRKYPMAPTLAAKRPAFRA